jgi:hypothetical protein|tara:strand:+ start:722 stop:1102 length:381 start_codon:yes stop_codon:yes gene_type:complete
MNNTETNLHIKIAYYIKHKYPDVIFTSESSGIKLSIGQAVMLKKMRSGRALPDLMLFEARKGFNGMFLEIKREGTSIYKRNGEIKRDKHLKEQEEVLRRLTNKGFFAKFVVGYANAIALIDYYLGN